MSEFCDFKEHTEVGPFFYLSWRKFELACRDIYVFIYYSVCSTFVYIVHVLSALCDLFDQWKPEASVNYLPFVDIKHTVTCVNIIVRFVHTQL